MIVSQTREVCNQVSIDQLLHDVDLSRAVLKNSWIPTPLVAPPERVPVPIVAAHDPSRFRTLYVFANFAGLTIVLVSLILVRRFDRQKYARRLRGVFERMGGLWIKAGQILALRIDIFPLEICKELANLQSQALGFPHDIARHIVEEELGAPLDQWFDRWEPAPIAAASIGQVHRARLRREGAWVAVKVQKPASSELFSRDLLLIRFVVTALKLLRVYPHMKWDAGLSELREIMKEELDFGYEASSTRRMRKNLRKHGVYVPKVFSRYSTPRVLVTELLPAVFMADYIRVAHEDPVRLRRWLSENDVNPRRVARHLGRSLQRQMLEDNLFHGDMHPGNIALLRGSRIALIDFGTTNFTEAEYLRKFALFTRSIATDDYAKAADMCLMLCASLPAIDIQLVRERLVRVLESWVSRTLVRELPYHDKSLHTMTLNVMRALLGFRCTMEWGWLRLHRAMSTLDATLIELYPELDHHKMVVQYFKQAHRRRVRALASGQAARPTLRVGEKAADIQDRVRDYAMFEAILIREHAQAFRAVIETLTSAAGAMLGLAMAAIIVEAAAVVAILISSWPIQLPGALRGPQLSSVAERLPRLEPQLCVLILLADALIWSSLRRVRRVLTRREVNIGSRTAATA
jgi:ubiquinone biosynthesis protein